MKLHDLRPAAGLEPAAAPGRAGHRRQGRQDRRPGHQGPRRPDNVKPGFEGGQLPLTQRIPKLKGFKNPFRVVVQRDQPRHARRLRGDVVKPETLVAAGLVHKGGLVRCSAAASSTGRWRSAHAFSASARAAIEAAGGTVEVLPPPFGNGRPPAKGNALTNR